MRTRFYNARILTMEEGRDIFEGELWVVGDRIIFVGTEEEGRHYCDSHKDTILVWDEEIDCKKNLLMPGFKNAHTHSAMALMRSKADDLPLSDWLGTQIFPIEAKMTAEDIYHLSKISIMEYLTSGMTAAFEMYLTPFPWQMLSETAASDVFRQAASITSASQWSFWRNIIQTLMAGMSTTPLSSVFMRSIPAQRSFWRRPLSSPTSTRLLSGLIFRRL